MQPDTYLFPPWLAVVWVLGWLCLSIVYRRSRNKPSCSDNQMVSWTAYPRPSDAPQFSLPEAD